MGEPAYRMEFNETRENGFVEVVVMDRIGIFVSGEDLGKVRSARDDRQK